MNRSRVAIISLFILLLVATLSFISPVVAQDGADDYTTATLSDLEITDVERTSSSDGSITTRVTVKGEQPAGSLPWNYPVTVQANSSDQSLQKTAYLIPTSEEKYTAELVFTMRFQQDSGQDRGFEFSVLSRNYQDLEDSVEASFFVEGSSSVSDAESRVDVGVEDVGQAPSQHNYVSRYRASEGFSQYLSDDNIPMDYPVEGRVRGFTNARDNNRNGSIIAGVMDSLSVVTSTRAIPDSPQHSLIIRYQPLNNTSIQATPVDASGEKIDNTYNLPEEASSEEYCFGLSDSNVCVIDLSGDEVGSLNTVNEMFLRYHHENYTSFSLYCQGLVSSSVPSDTSDVCGFGGDVNPYDPPRRLQAPVAEFEVDNPPVYQNESAVFNATESYDIDGEIVKYEWNWKAEADDEYEDSTENATINHTYNVTGEYVVQLRVTDNDGLTDTVTKTYNVSELSNIEADFTYAPGAPAKGQTILFNANESYSTFGDIERYRWSWRKEADNVGDVEYNMTSTTETTTHAYIQEGIYNVTLQVIDNQSNTANVTKPVPVGVDPELNAGIRIEPGDTITIDVDLGEKVNICRGDDGDCSNGTVLASFNETGYCRAVNNPDEHDPIFLTEAEQFQRADQEQRNAIVREVYGQPENWDGSGTELAPERARYSVNIDYETDSGETRTLSGTDDITREQVADGNDNLDERDITENRMKALITYEIADEKGVTEALGSPDENGGQITNITVQEVDSTNDPKKGTDPMYWDEKPLSEMTEDALNRLGDMGRNGRGCTVQIQAPPPDCGGALNNCETYTVNKQVGDDPNPTSCLAIGVDRKETYEVQYNGPDEVRYQNENGEYVTRDVSFESDEIVVDPTTGQYRNVPEDEIEDAAVEEFMIRFAASNDIPLDKTVDDYTNVGENDFTYEQTDSEFVRNIQQTGDCVISGGAGGGGGGGGGGFGGGGGGGGVSVISSPPELDIPDSRTIQLGDKIIGNMSIVGLNETQDVTQYAWDMNVENPESAFYTTQNITHVYDNPGRYVVRAAAEITDTARSDSDDTFVLSDKMIIYVENGSVQNVISDLNNTIQNSSDGDVIELQEDALLASPLDVDKEITILGNGHTIQGDIEITDSEVTFQNTDIIGQLVVRSKNFAFNNGTVDNTADSDEYAVILEGSSPQISNSEVLGGNGIAVQNTATGTGIGSTIIDTQGRGILVAPESSDILLSDNDVESGGNAIHINGNTTADVIGGNLSSDKAAIRIIEGEGIDINDINVESGRILEAITKIAGENDRIHLNKSEVVNRDKKDVYNIVGERTSYGPGSIYNGVHITTDENVSIEEIIVIQSTPGAVLENLTIQEGIVDISSDGSEFRNVVSYGGQVNVGANNTRIIDSDFNSGIEYIEGYDGHEILNSEVSGSIIARAFNSLTVKDSYLSGENALVFERRVLSTLVNNTIVADDYAIDANGMSMNGLDSEGRSVILNIGDNRIESGQFLTALTLDDNVDNINLENGSVRAGNFTIDTGENKTVYNQGLVTMYLNGTSLSAEDDVLLRGNLRMQSNNQSITDVTVESTQDRPTISIRGLNTSVSDSIIRNAYDWGIRTENNRQYVFVDNNEIYAQKGIRVDRFNRDERYTNNLINAEDTSVSIDDETENITFQDNQVISGTALNASMTLAEPGDTIIIKEGRIVNPDSDYTIPTNTSVYTEDFEVGTPNITVKQGENATIKSNIDIIREGILLQGLQTQGRIFANENERTQLIDVSASWADIDGYNSLISNASFFGDVNRPSLRVGGSDTTVEDVRVNNDNNWGLVHGQNNEGLTVENLTGSAESGVKIGNDNANVTLSNIDMDIQSGVPLIIPGDFVGSELDDISFNGGEGRLVGAAANAADEGSTIIVDNQSIRVPESGYTIETDRREYGGENYIIENNITITTENNATINGQLDLRTNEITIKDATMGNYSAPSIYNRGDYNTIENVNIGNFQDWAIIGEDNKRELTINNSTISAERGIWMQVRQSNAAIVNNRIRVDEDNRALRIDEPTEVYLDSNTILSGDPISAAIDAADVGDTIIIGDGYVENFNKYTIQTGTDTYNSDSRVNTPYLFITAERGVNISGSLSVNQPHTEIINVDFNGSGTKLDINADNTTVDLVKIRGSGGTGIDAPSQDKLTITRTNITGNDRVGVDFRGVTNSNINNLTAKTGDLGVLYNRNYRNLNITNLEVIESDNLITLASRVASPGVDIRAEKDKVVTDNFTIEHNDSEYGESVNLLSEGQTLTSNVTLNTRIDLERQRQTIENVTLDGGVSQIRVREDNSTIRDSSISTGIWGIEHGSYDGTMIRNISIDGNSGIDIHGRAGSELYPVQIENINVTVNNNPYNNRYSSSNIVLGGVNRLIRERGLLSEYDFVGSVVGSYPEGEPLRFEENSIVSEIGGDRVIHNEPGLYSRNINLRGVNNTFSSNVTLESVDIRDRGITLRDTIISNNDNHGIDVYPSDVTIQDVQINNEDDGSYWSIITSGSPDNLEILSSRISGDYGIYIDNGQNILIKDNYINANEDPLRLNTDDVELVNNTIIGNVSVIEYMTRGADRGDTIELGKNKAVNIDKGTEFTHNSNGVYEGGEIKTGNLTIRESEDIEVQGGITIPTDNNKLEDITVNGKITINSYNNTLSNMNISSSGDALLLDGGNVDDIVISNSTIQGTVHKDNGNRAIIEDTTITSQSRPVRVRDGLGTDGFRMRDVTLKGDLKDESIVELASQGINEAEESPLVPGLTEGEEITFRENSVNVVGEEMYIDISNLSNAYTSTGTQFVYPDGVTINTRTELGSNISLIAREQSINGGRTSGNINIAGQRSEVKDMTITGSLRVMNNNITVENTEVNTTSNNWAIEITENIQGTSGSTVEDTIIRNVTTNSKKGLMLRHDAISGSEYLTLNGVELNATKQSLGIQPASNYPIVRIQNGIEVNQTRNIIGELSRLSSEYNTLELGNNSINNLGTGWTVSKKSGSFNYSGYHNIQTTNLSVTTLPNVTLSDVRLNLGSTGVTLEDTNISGSQPGSKYVIRFGYDNTEVSNLSIKNVTEAQNVFMVSEEAEDVSSSGIGTPGGIYDSRVENFEGAYIVNSGNWADGDEGPFIIEGNYLQGDSQGIMLGRYTHDNIIRDNRIIVNSPAVSDYYSDGNITDNIITSIGGDAYSLSDGWNTENNTVNIPETTITSNNITNRTFELNVTHVREPITSVNYTWMFGDGNSSTGRNVTHTYQEGGIYNVTLQIEDEYGVTKNKTYEVIAELDIEGEPSSCMELLVTNRHLQDKNGVYEINQSGQTVEVYCDMTTDGGGWTLVSSNYFNDSTIPGGKGTQSSSYHLGSSITGDRGISPNGDYIIGDVISDMNYDTARITGWGWGEVDSTPHTYESGYVNGTSSWLSATWTLTEEGNSRLTETVPSRVVDIDTSGMGVDSRANYYVLDTMRADSIDSYDCYDGQCTVGGSGIQDIGQDLIANPGEGTFVGNGENEENSQEGWYDSSGTRYASQGYATWVRQSLSDIKEDDEEKQDKQIANSNIIANLYNESDEKVASIGIKDIEYEQGGIGLSYRKDLDSSSESTSIIVDNIRTDNNVIDTFEDNDISEWDNVGIESWSITSNSIQGDYSVVADSGQSTMLSMPNTDAGIPELSYYPQRGDNITFETELNNFTNSSFNFRFGVADSSESTYTIGLNSNNEMFIGKTKSGSLDKTNLEDISIDKNGTYEFEILWGTNKTIDTIGNRETLEVYNPNEGDLSNYPIRVKIDYEENMNSNFSDIEFKQYGFNIPYWIKDYTPNEEATVWLKPRNLEAKSTSSIQMIYGDNNSSMGDPHRIFRFYDDFNDDSLGSNWTTTSSVSYEIVDGELRVDSGSVYTSDKVVNVGRGMGVAIEAKAEYQGDMSGDTSGISIASDNSMSGGNSNGDANVLHILDNNQDVSLWAADGSTNSYNICNGQYSTTVSTGETNILGIGAYSDKVSGFVDYTETVLCNDGLLDSDEINKNFLITLGHFNIESDRNGADIDYDWVRTRKLAENDPLINFEEEISQRVYESDYNGVVEFAPVDSSTEFSQPSGIDISDADIIAFKDGEIINQTTTNAYGEYGINTSIQPDRIVANIEGYELGEKKLYAGSSLTVTNETEYANFTFNNYKESEIGGKSVLLSYNVSSSDSQIGAYPGLDMDITNVYQLQGIEETPSQNYELALDIDASETARWINAFQPIENFDGNFSGNSYNIDGLTIDNSDRYVGLFSQTDDSTIISNLSMTDVSVSGRRGVGTIAGRNYGLIENVFVEGDVESSSYNTGGIVGRNPGTITATYSLVDVTGGNNNIGGIAGWGDSGTIKNSYAAGEVEGYHDDIGGIIGDSNNPTVKDSYWDISKTSQKKTSNGGTGLYTSEMTGEDAEMSMRGLKFNSTWSVDSGYPYLKSLSTEVQKESQQVTYKDSPVIIPSSGDGSTDNPYVIENAGQLQYIKNEPGKNYTITSNISEDTENWFNGNGFTPIGNPRMGKKFTGEIDGNGYVIEGISVDYPSMRYIGMFSRTSEDSSIRNINLRNVNIDGRRHTGGLVGRNEGLIENSSVVGEITSTYRSAGGLVGWNYGTINSSYTSGYTEADSYNVGGLVGRNPGFINNSYSLTDVHTGRGTIGSLVGWGDSGTVKNSYGVGSITFDGSNGNMGGLIGGGNSVTVEDSYWNTETTGYQTSYGGGSGKTTSEMTGEDAVITMDKLGFSTYWESVSDSQPNTSSNKYPIIKSMDRGLQIQVQNIDGEESPIRAPDSGNGSVEDPYVIENIGELQYMKEEPSKNYVLGGDIDASNASSWFNGKGFKPIGDPDTSSVFTGSIDGQGHIIEGLTIDRPDDNNIGLIAYAGGDSRISNIQMRNADIIGNRYVGGIVGENHGEIRNSYVIGRVEATYRAGGLITGWNNGIIDTAYSDGSVIVDRYNGGGIAGRNNDDAIINRTYSLADVEVGDASAGGIAGWGNSGTVKNSFATGRIQAGRDSGGVVGNGNNPTTIDSYWDRVTTDKRTTFAGGEGLRTSDMTGDTAKISMDGLNFGDTWSTVNKSDGGMNTYPILSEFNSSYQIELRETTSDINYIETPESGDGSTNNPYVVNNAKQLQYMNVEPNKNYILGSDIDASNTKSWYNYSGFKPIGISNINSKFTGSFDGNNHTIESLTINRPNDNNVGLFAWAEDESTIKNVILRDLSITGEYRAGMIGRNDGRIENVYVSGNIEAHAQSGLISGRNYGDIINTASSGSVSTDWRYAGGLVGQNRDSGIISNSYSIADVDGDNDVGGLVGWGGDSTVSDSYAAGSVSSNHGQVGGIMGDGHNPTVENTYWNIDTTGQYYTYDNVGMGLYTSEMTGEDANLTMNPIISNDIWVLVDSSKSVFSKSSYPIIKSINKSVQLSYLSDISTDSNIEMPQSGEGTLDEPYHIENVEQLQYMRIEPDKNYELVSDIDATSTSSWFGYLGFKPIGEVNTGPKFTGSFDGNNHTISGLTITRRDNPDDNNVGLFAWVEDEGVIKNLRMKDSLVTGEYRTSIVSGRNDGRIENVYAAGSVESHAQSGLIVGRNYGTIESVASSGSVSTDWRYAGGITGQNRDSGIINNSYSLADVDGDNDVGGLVGWGGDSTVSDSYAAGSVSSNHGQVGGIMGDGHNPTVEDTYWNIDTTGYRTTYHDDGTGLYTSEMTGEDAEITMNGLDFNSTWDIVNETRDGYPILRIIDREMQTSAQSVDGSDAPVQVPDGAGTVDNPYIIENVEELQYMDVERGSHYILENDIWAGNTGSWFDGRGFKSVGNFHRGARFSGTFDGRSNNITGLTIDRPNEYYVGLFANTEENAVVENINLKEVSVNGYAHVGGLVGRHWGIIENVEVSGSVDSYFLAGVVVGRNDGTIRSTASSGSVSTDNGYVGGITGQNRDSGIINNSYSVADVDGEEDVGGLIGWSDGTVRNSYAAGSVSSNNYQVGGVIGSGGSSTVEDIYWDTQATGQSDSYDGGEGLTTSEMTSNNAKNNMDGLNYNKDWNIVEGDYPEIVESGVMSNVVVSQSSVHTGENITFSAYSDSNNIVEWFVEGKRVATGKEISISFDSTGEKKVTAYQEYEGKEYSESESVDIYEPGLISDTTSCEEILTYDVDWDDGVYDIDYDTDGSTESVYCDMTTDGGGWTLVASHVDSSYFNNTRGGDDGSILFKERKEAKSKFNNVTKVGSVEERKSQDVVLRTYTDISFDKMMFEDSEDNYIAYDVKSGENVENWFRNLDSGIDFENKTHYCNVDSCIEVSDGPFSPYSTNINPDTVNEPGSLDIRFKAEDSDSPPGHRWNSWSYGPTWPSTNNGNYKWDDVSSTWTLNRLGGQEAGQTDYIYWFVK
jgi:hypothetical protein